MPLARDRERERESGQTVEEGASRVDERGAHKIGRRADVRYTQSSLNWKEQLTFVWLTIKYGTFYTARIQMKLMEDEPNQQHVADNNNSLSLSLGLVVFQIQEKPAVLLVDESCPVWATTLKQRAN